MRWAVGVHGPSTLNHELPAARPRITLAQLICSKNALHHRQYVQVCLTARGSKRFIHAATAFGKAILPVIPVRVGNRKTHVAD